MNTIPTFIINRFSKFLPDVKRVACVFAGLLSLVRVPGAEVAWICSTENQPWQTMPAPVLTAACQESPPEIRVASDKTFQTVDGFGGCFNERGWLALGKTSEAERCQVLKALFGDDGCADHHHAGHGVSRGRRALYGAGLDQQRVAHFDDHADGEL